MKYFLDTNIIIYALKNTFPNIRNQFEKTPFTSIVVPDIVLAELEYGARKSNNYEKTIDLYNQFTNNFETFYFDKNSIIEYGKIRNTLQKTGNIIGANDLIIASIVKANRGILVTHNVKEFTKVEGLMIEDWC